MTEHNTNDKSNSDELEMAGVSGLVYEENGVTYRRYETDDGDIVDERVEDGHKEPVLVTDGGTATFEGVTLIVRENDEKSMEYGRYDGERYFTDDNDIAEEDTEFVELEEPKTAETLDTWDIEDFPERVQEFAVNKVEA